MTIPDFTTWNMFETRWTSGEAKYLVDGEVKATHTNYVPTTDLHIKFTEGNVDCGTVYTDWIFLRKFVDLEPAPGGPASNVKVYVDMPLGYIPGAPPGDLVSVDLYIDTDIIDDTPDGIVQWAISAQVDPTVLEPMGVLGAAPGYFLYDYLIRSGLSDMGYITGSVLYGVDKAAGKIYWITEAILPSPPTGAGAVPGQMPYKLCTLTFKSLSETAYSPIDLFYEEGVDAWYRTPDGVSHAVDLVEDGHYNARANVKVYVDQPLGYIPGVPVGDSFTVDMIIEVSNITDFSADGIVGWGLSLAVDPDVLNITGAIGAASGYFLWEFADAWSESYPIQLSNINATAGLADVTEQIIPSPLGGAGDPWSGLKLVTLAFTSKSETAHALIDLVKVEYMTPDGMWHPVNEITDGYYNPPPAPDLSVEGIVLPYISMVPLVYPTPDPEFAYKINATVTNEGTADAGSFNVSFSAYWEGEETPEVSQKKIITSLEQGVTGTVKFEFSPENFGNYTIVVMADCDNDVVEFG